MAKPSPAQPDEEVEGKHQRAERQAAAIAASVMGALGHPPNLFRVTVVRLWGNRFRVNVHTGTDLVTAHIAHSFFALVDDNGKVTESVPAITRLY
jgi:hypothetical protein